MEFKPLYGTIETKVEKKTIDVFGENVDSLEYVSTTITGYQDVSVEVRTYFGEHAAGLGKKLKPGEIAYTMVGKEDKNGNIQKFCYQISGEYGPAHSTLGDRYERAHKTIDEALKYQEKTVEDVFNELDTRCTKFMQS